MTDASEHPLVLALREVYHRLDMLVGYCQENRDPHILDAIKLIRDCAGRAIIVNPTETVPLIAAILPKIQASSTLILDGNDSQALNLLLELERQLTPSPGETR